MSKLEELSLEMKAAARMKSIWELKFMNSLAKILVDFPLRKWLASFAQKGVGLRSLGAYFL